MAFTSIPTSAILSGKPITEQLMGWYRDNDDYLKALFHISTGHTHDGVTADDGPPISAVAAAAIAQAELKTAMGEVSRTGSGGHKTLPGGQYGFYPQIKVGTNVDCTYYIGLLYQGESYSTNIWIDPSATGGTGYAQQRYIQASPPYKIGDMLWGHFVFVLRNLSTGKIVASYQAEDPPWAYNGNPNYPKDDVRRIQEIPHPFADYRIKDPAVDGLEVALLDLRTFDMAKFKTDSAKIDKSILENMEGNIIISPTKKPLAAIGIPEIIGFTDKVFFRDIN